MIYLASPYTHPDPVVVNDRFEAVCRAAGRFMEQGYLVYSPIAHTHPIAVRAKLPTDWTYWEKFDRAMISACESVHVLQLDGWAESRGVTAEIAIADELGKPVVYVSEWWGPSRGGSRGGEMTTVRTTTTTVEGRVIADQRRELRPMVCNGCGVLYALDEKYWQNRYDDGKSWYCPNGCARSYSRTETVRLREQLEQRQRALDGALDRLATEQRSHSATRGQLTKVRNRIHEGVCPECNRTFVNVARHMRSRHKGPDEAKAIAEEMKAG